MSTRRDFLKHAMTGCALLATVGITGLVTGCKSLPIVKTTVVDKTITLDNALLQDNTVHIVRTKEIDYDLLLVRENAGGYHCLLMQCTHQDYALSFTGNALVCNQHGSQFDLQGNVKKDPALQPLRQYPVTVVNDKVVIQLV